MANKSEILLYRTEDERTEIQVTLQDETVGSARPKWPSFFRKTCAQSVSTYGTSIKRASLKEIQLSGISG